MSTAERVQVFLTTSEMVLLGGFIVIAVVGTAISATALWLAFREEVANLDDELSSLDQEIENSKHRETANPPRTFAGALPARRATDRPERAPRRSVS